MGNRLQGRVAIVTGGGGGIGRSVARWLAREGASVVVNDLGGAVDGTSDSTGPADAAVADITSEGGTAVASYDSVADFESAGRIVQAAIDNLGKGAAAAAIQCLNLSFDWPTDLGLLQPAVQQHEGLLNAKVKARDAHRAEKHARRDARFD